MKKAEPPDPVRRHSGGMYAGRHADARAGPDRHDGSGNGDPAECDIRPAHGDACPSGG